MSDAWTDPRRQASIWRDIARLVWRLRWFIAAFIVTYGLAAKLPVVGGIVIAVIIAYSLVVALGAAGGPGLPRHYLVPRFTALGLAIVPIAGGLALQVGWAVLLLANRVHFFEVFGRAMPFVSVLMSFLSLFLLVALLAALGPRLVRSVHRDRSQVEMGFGSRFWRIAMAMVGCIVAIGIVMAVTAYGAVQLKLENIFFFVQPFVLALVVLAYQIVAASILMRATSSVTAQAEVFS